MSQRCKADRCKCKDYSQKDKRQFQSLEAFADWNRKTEPFVLKVRFQSPVAVACAEGLEVWKAIFL